MRKRIVVAGAGGFIGGHLAKRLHEQGHSVIAVDKKPFDEWHQTEGVGAKAQYDLSMGLNCRTVCHGADEVYQLAADMGGMGFIEKHRIECMRSVLVNVHMLDAAQRAGAKKFFFSSSACVYNAGKQASPDVTALKEEDAYPAMAERGYGWEKLYSEMLCQEYWCERGMETYIARFHNVYGPLGTWKGGREKAPAAICRKVAEAVRDGTGEIEIWGDGTATRSFMWIDDCIDGIQKIVDSKELIATPINLGSSELVSVNALVHMVEEVAGVKLFREYLANAPKGVAGRNSDNSMIRSVLGWEPNTPLREGIEKLYHWVKEQVYGER